MPSVRAEADEVLEVGEHDRERENEAAASERQPGQAALRTARPRPAGSIPGPPRSGKGMSICMARRAWMMPTPRSSKAPAIVTLEGQVDQVEVPLVGAPPPELDEVPGIDDVEALVGEGRPAEGDAADRIRAHEPGQQCKEAGTNERGLDRKAAAGAS